MADVELLPSSVAAFAEALRGERGSLDAWLEVNDEREVVAHVEAYARANVEHHTAALQAEVEALLAERDALREALTEVLRVNETDAGNDVKAWANAMLNAHAALAQGQGGSDAQRNPD